MWGCRSVLSTLSPAETLRERQAQGERGEAVQAELVEALIFSLPRHDSIELDRIRLSFSAAFPS